jgi:hypothetical protein
MPAAEEPGGAGGWARLIPKQGTGIVGRLSTVAMVVFAAMGVGVYSSPSLSAPLNAATAPGSPLAKPPV